MTTTRNVVWQPQKGSQEAFLTCPVFEALYEGTRGPGKTDALIMDFAQFVDHGFGPSWKGILFRRTYKELTDVISKSKRWLYQIWPKAKYNNSEHYWTFPDGEQLLFRQFMREDDYWSYHGHEYPWIGWEELCNWPSDAGYKLMMSCCRSSTRGLPRRYRATANPYGPGHNWVKMRFRLPAARGQVIRDSADLEGRPEPPRVAIHGHIRENKILLEADPLYIQNIIAAARNPAQAKAWLDADWDIVAGGMFDDVFDPRYNVVKPFDIPRNWRIDRSFDWGSSKPFSVGWWAESDGSDYKDHNGKWRSSVPGDLFRINEWYGWNGKPNEGLTMLATDVAKGIIEREIKWNLRGRVRAGPADSSIFTQEDGDSIADRMEEMVRLSDGSEHYGISWLPADKRPGSRKSGWELMRQAIAAAHPVDQGVREKPGLFVFDICAQFLRTVPVLSRDEKDMDDVDTDTEDHIGDEVRYRVRNSGHMMKQLRAVGGY